MKKIIMFSLLGFLLVFVTGCTEGIEGTGEYYVLPDFNGYYTEEIKDKLDEVGQSYSIQYFEEEFEIYEDQFIMYVNYNTGDIVDKTDDVIIMVYPEFTGERTFLRLPDLTGYDRDEIELYFEDYDINVSFSETPDSTKENSGLFVGYGGLKEIGDMFSFTSRVSVIVNKIYSTGEEYYFPIDVVYDGPYLSDIYKDIDPVDPRGGYFDVGLYRCSDGDTAVFDYPTDVYNAIVSSAKSTRFLNMDTEETFSGGEEEWGKSGSVYTCSLLDGAEEIRLQTDPNSLTGTYGRLLAWVWVRMPGETEFFLVNYMVVKQGLAQVKYEFGSGIDLEYDGMNYSEWMHKAENFAKENDLGQWGDLRDYYWDYQNDQPDFSRWH